MNAISLPGQLYQVTRGTYCAGLIVVEGQVVHAAPVLRWAIGKQWQEVRRSLDKMRAHIAAIEKADVTVPLTDPLWLARPRG